MRKLLFCLCVLSAVFSCKKSSTTDPPPASPTTADSLNGWQKINTGIAGNLVDVAFVTPAAGFLATGNGAFRSADSGKTWAKATAITSVPYTINFLNARYGYAVGDNYLQFTTDGGANWRSKTIGSFGAVTDVCFVNPATGFASALNGPILKTTDTGTTWRATTASFSSPCFSVFFLNDQQGWYAAGNALFRTVNSGVLWTGQKVTDDLIYTVFFTDASNGWLTADTSVYRTVNGGASWSKTSVGAPCYDVQFLNAQTGYVSVSNGVYKTTDGGLTWKRNLTAAMPPFAELFFLDENTGWVTADNNVLYRWKK